MRNAARERKAVVILSGGLDSTVCMAAAVSVGLKVYGLTFDYGQRHRRELKAAAAVARHYGVEHTVVSLPDIFASNALTKELNKLEVSGEIRAGIPATYVPARNILFLSYGLAWAENVGAEQIYIGVNATDYTGYPDCRPAFIEAFQQMIEVGTEAGLNGRAIQICAPLMQMTKKEIIQWGIELKAPLGLTHTCYQNAEPPCGVCDSCRLRKAGFAEAGKVDPLSFRPMLD
ncbi:7-cyano-7-deazaguanine synthase QueC [Heliophilum fasciatum]|uniref:7-cyano-7-deazaguanine synthase n=1 Tax=Heliophilum fasciatum TaxID=35700 RepID=A0A4R2RIZ6_9FIRM|nr:7-cyano-7-deazaguanine synthase QueC [Heliophilum fasciatum]MCW2278347.1 7-cyano-7-deazaguanine synthase [Heliophilum fasciatum]TCP63780.1 preQ(0) biosynthesis protein QueC [Heliophilum fasciatum]